MALWKTQPTLRLFVQQPVRVGDTFTATLEVEAGSPVPVEWIDLTLEAVEGWSVGAGKNRVSRVHRYPSLVARVVGEAELSGTSRHQVTFSIPATQPPSRDGGTAYVRYSLYAQASIPWWPDARSRWPLQVRAQIHDASASPAVVQSQASELLEISLESQRIANGGVVGGLLAIKKPEPTPRVVDVTLREVLTLVSWNGFERVRFGSGYTVAVTLTPEVGKAPFRFRFADAAPSFRGETFRHEWELLIAPRYGGLFAALQGESVRVPVEMIESPALAERSERLIAPSVGDTRLGELVASVARRRPGWSADGSRLERTLESAFGSIDARLEWVSLDAGTYLRATIEPPRLGLGLHVGRAALFDRLLGDLEVGVAAWDSAHHVEVREAAQGKAFLAPIALASSSLEMTASDDTIELQRVDPTIDASSLEAFVDEIDAVLGELAGALAAIPPPTGTSVDRTEASRLAKLSHGTFHPGDLALRGRVDDRMFEAGLVFEGSRAVALRVQVSPLPEGTLHVGPGRDDLSLAGVPRAARSSVAALAPGITLAIEGGRGQILVPAPTTPLFGVDHERSIAFAGLLVGLARSLSPEAGPFR
ncbi:MAG: hypothetical protein K1X94_17170 [Sandaracinaceae bacterium]|nr:hypothetical protein [Sandaracinaceae bacterium]